MLCQFVFGFFFLFLFRSDYDNLRIWSCSFFFVQKIDCLCRSIFCLFFSKLLIYFIEIYAVIYHHRFKLGEWLVHDFFQDVVRREGEFVSAFNGEALARVHIDAFTVFRGLYLKGAQPFYLHLLVGIESLVAHIKHLPDEEFCFHLAQTALISKQFSECI